MKKFVCRLQKPLAVAPIFIYTQGQAEPGELHHHQPVLFSISIIIIIIIIMSKITVTTTASAESSVLNTFSWLLRYLTPASKPGINTTEAGAPLLGEGKSSTSQNMLYLAYGSNLNRATFEGRRGIKPISATVVCVPALRLEFNLPGIAYLEPRFANVRFITEKPEAMKATGLLPPQGYRDGQEDNDPEPPLVGVVYEVTPTDFATIIATEGGGASYQDVLVDCFPISSSPSPSSAEPLRAHTLLAPGSRTRQGHAQASARYLGLIAAGAAQHDLPLSYRNHIARYRPYQTTSVGQRIGRVFFMGLWLPIVFCVFGLSRVVQGPGGRAPAWAANLTGTLFATMWWTYDRGFKQLFGDGESTVEAEERLGVDVKIDVDEILVDVASPPAS